MLAPKYKAMLLVSLLVLAIGVPVIVYASIEHTNTNEKPVARISAPGYGFTNMPILFSAKKSSDADGHITMYIWDFGDGTTSAGEYVNHTYMKVGNYTVKLTVYDNAGDKSSATKKIEISYYEEKSEKASVNELIKNPAKYIGREVVVRGVFVYGHNYSFYMVNESGYRGLHVYVEPGGKKPGKMNYGDLIEVAGRFTAYNNELEMKVENNTHDYVIVLSHNAKTTYARVNESNWMSYNNSLIEVTSKVRDVIASYRYTLLNFTVYVSYGANHTGTPAVGDIFDVKGFLTYYHSSKYNYGYMELYVRNNTADYSRYVSSNYEATTIKSVLDSPDNFNNTAVNITKAWITSVSSSWSFTVSYGQNSTDSIKVYVEKGAKVDGMVFRGAKVSLRGVVVEYKGNWELKIRSGTPDIVVVLTKPVYVDVDVSELEENPNNYNGTNVHSWGIISWSYHNSSSGLWLIGLFFNGSEVTVVGFAGSNISNIISGYHADVYGIFTYYSGNWEIKIRPNSYDFVKTKPQNYTNVNITDILNSPQRYNNTLVHIPYSKIVKVYRTWKFWVSNSSGNKDIVVYVEKGGEVNGIPTVGFNAEIWAMVTEYNGTWELKVRNSTDDRVNVTGAVNYTTVQIETLLQNTSEYNNTLVHVPLAVVTYVYNSSWLFYVSNNTNNTSDISVYIEKGGNLNATIYKGAKVEIWAMVTQYNGKWELEVRNNTSDRVKNVETVSYVNVSIEELLTNESKYNNTNIHIPNATVVNVHAAYLFWVSNSTNNSNDIAVYVQSGVSVPAVGVGDVIEIYGNVTYHNGSYEITLRTGTPDRINVLSSSAKYVNFSYIHEVDENGTLVHIGEQVIVNGTVIVPSNIYSYTTSSGTHILKFYIENITGGVQVFGYLNYSRLNLSEGDVVKVRGTIDQYNGETELKVSSLEYITVIGHGENVSPKNVTGADFSNWTYMEKMEGTLVRINGTVSDVYTGTSFVKITVDNDNTSMVVFVRNSWGINTTNISKGDNITVVGIVGQYDSTSPYTSGYEVFPRYQNDIIDWNDTKSKSKDAKMGDDSVNMNNFDAFNEVVAIWKRRNIVLIAEGTWVH